MTDIPDLGEGFLEMWRELLLLAKQVPVPSIRVTTCDIEQKYYT
jgi:hypothetical protein